MTGLASTLESQGQILVGLHDRLKKSQGALPKTGMFVKKHEQIHISI
jgi:hypothetical protein